MSRSSKGGRPAHRLTPYINLLPNIGERERKCRCKACENELGEEAKIMTNRKERVKEHLMSCEYFIELHGQVHASEILDYSDTEETHKSKKAKTIINLGKKII